MDIYEQHHWHHVRELVRVWPGATRIAPDALEAYMQALVYPNGHDRAARTDPVELERVLRSLLERDRKGARPPVGVVVDELAAQRRARRPTEPDELPAGGEPAEDWVLAHAIARSLPIVGAMRVIARRHGRNEHPRHDATTCSLCEVERREDAFAAALERKYGGDWLKVDAALAELTAHELELDVLFPWRVSS